MSSIILPTLTGTNDQEALHEIHIFLKDLNPSEDVLKRYNSVVAEWNEKYPDNVHKMKACFLALVFRDAEGKESVVKVMQSARYIRSNETQQVVNECRNDTKWFEDRGLEVVREKIEAMAYGIKEIPLEDAVVPKGKYFEFHIKVGRKDAEKECHIEDSEIDSLRKISQMFSREFKIPVPLSYNENKNKVNQDGEGHQRFLNLRFRKGRNDCVGHVNAVKSAIDDLTSFKVLKVISEYVWFDTYTEMDKGWIDYTPEELSKMFGK